MKNMPPELERLLRDYRAELSEIRLDVPAADLPELGTEAVPSGSGARTAAPERLAPPAPAPAVARAPARLGRVAALALAAALGAAGARQWYVRASARVQRSYPLPWTHAGALAFQGANLVAVDPQRQLLFTVATDGSGVRDVQKIQNPSVSGLTFGNGCLWSSNAESGSIYQHDLDRDHAVRRAYANPDQNPSALFWDGTYLWASDARTETIYAYSAGEALTPVKQFTLPKASPAGLYVSGDRLWIFDAATSRLSRYRMGISLTPADSLDLSARLPAGAKVTGFSVDHSSLWLITDAPAGLHRFDLDSVFLTPKKS